MYSYNEVLVDLKNTLQKDNIECNENQISLYDLFLIINYKFELLRSVTQNDNLFTSKQFLHRKKYVLEIVQVDDQMIKIKINDTDWNYSFKVCYNKNNDNIFFEGNKEYEKYIAIFMKKYNEELDYAFSILQMFYVYKSLMEIINNHIFKCDHYDFNINCMKDGIVDLEVSVSGEEKEISEIIEKSKFELSKKIMIDVNTLEPIMQTIVYKNLNNSRQKTLMKKITK